LQRHINNFELAHVRLLMWLALHQMFALGAMTNDLTNDLLKIRRISDTDDKQKARHFRGGLFVQLKNRLRSLDVGCLLALRTLNDVKGNLLAFFEGLEAAHVNRGEVREQVFAAIIRSNETETLCVVEPLNCTVCHVKTSLLKNRVDSR
jgi:hypothetical protein